MKNFQNERMVLVEWVSGGPEVGRSVASEGVRLRSRTFMNDQGWESARRAAHIAQN